MKVSNGELKAAFADQGLNLIRGPITESNAQASLPICLLHDQSSRQQSYSDGIPWVKLQDMQISLFTKEKDSGTELSVENAFKSLGIYCDSNEKMDVANKVYQVNYLFKRER